MLKFKTDLEFNEKSDWTITGYTRELQSFSDFLEKEYNVAVYVEDIKKTDIKNYLKHLKQRGLQPSSRNRILFILRSFYNFAVKEKIVEKNIAENFSPVKTRSKERVYLTKDEMEKLMEELEHPVVIAAARIMYYAGLRISECLGLKMEDLDLENDVIHVKNAKGKKDRDVPISDKLHQILVDYLENDRPAVSSKRVIATEQSGTMSNAYFNQVIRKAVNSLNWDKKVTAHTMRHSFAYNLVKRDVNIYKIQKLLGHANIKITSIYTHSNMDDLTDAVNII